MKDFFAAVFIIMAGLALFVLGFSVGYSENTRRAEQKVKIEKLEKYPVRRVTISENRHTLFVHHENGIDYITIHTYDELEIK
jgi:hypothetical protein